MTTNKKMDWSFVLSAIAGLFFIGVFIKTSFTSKSKAPVCTLQDGRYEVMADYYNPKRDTKKMHYMMIWVKDCEVELANFADGGWLYHNNILSSRISKDSTVYLVDDDSSTYNMLVMFGPK